MLVAHFGNGDEDDQTLISDYAKKFGELIRITIYPGVPYGHLEYSSPDGVLRLLADTDSENVKVFALEKGKEKHLAIFPTNLGHDELKNRSTVDFPCSTVA